MRTAWTVLLMLLFATPAASQTCTPTRIEGLVIGNSGESMIAPTARVPAGEIWLIKAAGLGTSANITWPVDYSLNIDHWVFGQGPIGSVGSWYIPIELADRNTYNGTPMMGLKRQIILEEGERLLARSNGLNGAKMDLFYAGWSFPASCLERLLVNGATVAQQSGNVTPPPDFTALLAAAQSAAAALSALAQSAP
jgi:hypothetical protein